MGVNGQGHWFTWFIMLPVLALVYDPVKSWAWAGLDCLVERLRLSHVQEAAGDIPRPPPKPRELANIPARAGDEEAPEEIALSDMPAEPQ